MKVFIQNNKKRLIVQVNSVESRQFAGGLYWEIEQSNQGLFIVGTSKPSYRKVVGLQKISGEGHDRYGYEWGFYSCAPVSRALPKFKPIEGELIEVGTNRFRLDFDREEADRVGVSRCASDWLTSALQLWRCRVSDQVLAMRKRNEQSACARERVRIMQRGAY